MQIIDEKSLIKKYQNEIRSLKDELERLKRGIVSTTQQDAGEDDIFLLKQKVGHSKWLYNFQVSKLYFLLKLFVKLLVWLISFLI